MQTNPILRQNMKWLRGVLAILYVLFIHDFQCGLHRFKRLRPLKKLMMPVIFQ